MLRLALRYWIVAILTLLLIACEPSQPDIQYQIVACAPMPSPRASAVSFVMDDMAYVFAGRDSADNYLNDLWRYDPQQDEWSRVGTTPLVGRVNATACVYGDRVYLGLGFNRHRRRARHRTCLLW